MDFNFGKKTNKGLSVLFKNDQYHVYIPSYINIDSNKLNNWINELEGSINLKKNDFKNLDFKNLFTEIIFPASLKPSDIYFSFYHFIE